MALSLCLLMGSVKRSMFLSFIPRLDIISEALDVVRLSLVKVCGQNMQSADIKALSPFMLINSGSPGPSDTNIIGCIRFF